MNSPGKSKINLIQLIALLIGVAGIWGFVDEEISNKINQTALIVIPFLTIIFRTFFTAPKWYTRLKKEAEKELIHDEHDLDDY